MQHSFLKYFDRINDKYGAWLFYLGLFLMIVGRSWFSTNKETPDAYFTLYLWFRHTGRLLLVCRLLLFSHKYPLYVLSCIIAFALIWYSHTLSGFRVLLYSFIIIAASKDTDFKTIQKVFLVAFPIILLVAFASWNLEWTGNIIKHKFNLIGHSRGLSNPNLTAFLLLMVTLLVLQYWDIKQTKVIWITCWSVAILVFILTLGLTSVTVLLLIPVLYYILCHYRIPSWSLALLPLICLLASILLSCYYGPSYGETTFESRFSIPALVYQNHGLSLFGQEYGYVNATMSKLTGAHTLCVDNIFLHLVLCDGIVIALLVYGFLGHFLYKIYRSGNPLLISSAIGITLSGMMEEILLDTTVNFMLLYYFNCFTPHSKTVSETIDS